MPNVIVRSASPGSGTFCSARSKEIQWGAHSLSSFSAAGLYFRDLYFTNTLDTVTLRTPGSRVARIFTQDAWILILEMRYTDDVSQSATWPCSSSVTEAFVRCLLRDRRNLRYRKINGKGINLEPGESDLFIGLLKSYDPFRGILLRPTCTFNATEPDPTDILFKSGVQHYLGWCPSRVPYATLCGFAARSISLSSTSSLASDALTDFFELFLTSGAYPSVRLSRLAAKWDGAHRVAPVSCATALSRALARSSHRL